MKLHVEAGHELTITDILAHLETYHAKLKERFTFDVDSTDHMTVEMKTMNEFLWFSNALSDFNLEWNVSSGSNRHPRYPSFQKTLTVHKPFEF